MNLLLPRWTLACLVLGIVSLGPATNAQPEPPQIPCGDPRGCPDLVVDETRFVLGTQLPETFTADDCAVQEGSTQPGTRMIMRFTFNSPNIGSGDLVVGAPADHPEWFEFGACHDHFHFREYADYRLWTITGFLAWNQLREDNPDQTAEEVLGDHPELLPDLVAGHKQGFCVIDVWPATPTTHGYAPPDLSDLYGDCDDNQGISRGWADEYIWLLDGQWVDVTDVAPGAYILEAEVNAERLYVEEDYTNNRAWLPVVTASIV